MADLAPVYDALRQADAAGDTAGAQKLAAYIRAQNAAPVAQATQAPPDTSKSSAFDWVKGAGQAGLALGSGALKGVNSAINDLLPGDSSGLQQQINTDPILNYHPSNPTGQSILGGIGSIASPITHILSSAKNAIANTAGQRTADVTGDLATLLGAKGVLGRVGEATAPVKAAVAPAEVTAATNAGFKLTPDQVGGSPVGSILQGLSGSAKLERSLSKQNAPIVNQLAADEIGVPKLTPANLKQAKAAPNSVYGQVEKLGDVPLGKEFQADLNGATVKGTLKNSAVEELKSNYATRPSIDAADAVADIRQLRADAGKNIKAPYAPSQNALGFAQRDIADALESQLERHVQTLSQAGTVPADLISQFRNARMQLAKIHSVQDAMKGGNISAPALAKQANRKVPLSGNLKTIADAANNFDRSFQDVSKIRDSGPFGVLDLGYGAAAGLAHPLAAAAVFARPLARAALASKPYQRTLSTPLPQMPGLLGLQYAPSLLTGQQQQQGLLGQ